MTTKVTVACKIAVPWFALQLCERREVSENTQTGPRTIEQWFRTGRVVNVRGTAYPAGTPPEGFPARPQLVAGYALTHGVDKEFWDAWVAQQAKAPYVQSGMIMAYEKLDMINGAARERVNELSGLEPLNPKSDPRVPRSTNGAVSSVSPDDGRRQAAA